MSATVRPIKLCFFHGSLDGNVLITVQGMPAFVEDTRWVEWQKKFEKDPSKISEMSRQQQADMPRIIEEYQTNGGFTMTGETVYMEFRRKLFRWRKGEVLWFNTGIVDTTERAPGADTAQRSHTRGFGECCLCG